MSDTPQEIPSATQNAELVHGEARPIENVAASQEIAQTQLQPTQMAQTQQLSQASAPQMTAEQYQQLLMAQQMQQQMQAQQAQQAQQLPAGSSDLVIPYDPAFSTNKKKKPRPHKDPKSLKEKGLRSFSWKVCEKIASAGVTTYGAVAEALVMEHRANNPEAAAWAAEHPGIQSADEKNIRRRIYDALNVLIAMDIISKDKKKIHWKGVNLPALDHVTGANLSVETVMEAQQRVAQKRARLEALALQWLATRHLLERNLKQMQPTEGENKEAKSADAPDRVKMPFILVRAPAGTNLDMDINTSQTQVHLKFNNPIEILDHHSILQYIGRVCQAEYEASLPQDQQMTFTSLMQVARPAQLTAAETRKYTPKDPNAQQVQDKARQNVARARAQAGGMGSLPPNVPSFMQPYISAIQQQQMYQQLLMQQWQQMQQMLAQKMSGQTPASADRAASAAAANVAQTPQTAMPQMAQMNPMMQQMYMQQMQMQQQQQQQEQDSSIRQPVFPPATPDHGTKRKAEDFDELEDEEPEDKRQRTEEEVSTQ